VQSRAVGGTVAIQSRPYTTAKGHRPARGRGERGEQMEEQIHERKAGEVRVTQVVAFGHVWEACRLRERHPR